MAGKDIGELGAHACLVSGFAPMVVSKGDVAVVPEKRGGVVISLNGGRTVVDIEDGNITVSGARVVNSYNGTVFLKALSDFSSKVDEEQDVTSPLIKASVNDNSLQIGSVLGEDYKLPDGLERLEGWIVYNFTDEGVPQLLEPSESGIENFCVVWDRADEHVVKLQAKGHEGARLWSPEDYENISGNIIEGGLSDKAQFDFNKKSLVFWGQSKADCFNYSMDTSPTAYAYSLKSDDGLGRREMHKSPNSAYVRATQDAPELVR